MNEPTLGRARMSVPAQWALWVAVAIFAASGAITQRLIALGAAHPVNGHNPISLCNTLFVGNLCALILLYFLHRAQVSRAAFARLTPRDWLAIVAVALLAGALAPALFLTALSMTSIGNVTLVARLEPLLTLALSAWLLREQTTIWEALGAVVCFIGVGCTVALQGAFSATSGNSLGIWLVAVAAVALAVANIVNRRYLAAVPMGLFSVVRTALGTLVFFVVALLLYGSHHFAEAFSPFLWQWMVLYGGLIVVVGQSLWTKGLRETSAADAALAEAFNPVGAILAAYWILGEVPSTAQVVGGAIVLLGLGFGLVGAWGRFQDSMRAVRQMVGSDLGFRGL